MALGFGVLGFLSASDAIVNSVGFSIVGVIFFPAGALALGCRSGFHAATPVLVLIVYIGAIQLVVNLLYPAMPSDRSAS
eukprot:102598-Prymnesium_polylepis.1